MDVLERCVRSGSRRLLIAAAALLACAVPGAASGAAAAGEPHSIAAVYHCSYYPVSFVDEKTGKPAGFFVDLMDSVASRAGLQVTYTCRDSWPGMIKAITSGESDLGALLRSAEREKTLAFSIPVEITYLSFFVRSQSMVDADRIPTGYEVGVIKGSMSHEQIREYRGADLHMVDSYQRGIFGLLSGEFDVFAGEEARIRMHAREVGLEGRIRKVGKPFVERERGLAVRKDNVRLLAILNKALTDYVGGEEYQAIYLKWYGAPEQYWTIARLSVAGGITLFISVLGMAGWRYRSITRINRELMRSIAEREKAEEALWRNRNMLNHILNALPQSVFWKDRNSVYLGCNDVFARAAGVEHAAQIAGKTDFDLPWPHEDAAAYRDDDREVMSANRPKYHIVEPLQQADGTRLWIDMSKVPLTDRDGAVFGVLGVYEDITERIRSEEKHKESEQFIRKILDTVDEGFIVIDRDYRIVTANKAYCSQVGLTGDETIGRHCFEISHNASRPCFEEGEDCAVRHVFSTGEPQAVLHKHRDADGRVLYVETKAFPIKDAAGNVTTAIETINNITEKHLLEEERLKTQKLESIGTLAGGIAHDFNNLLQGVFGFISIAKLAGEDRTTCAASLDEAEKALHLAVKLTNQLLTFSKGGRPVRRPLDLRPIVTNAARFALAGSRSDFKITETAGTWHAEADDGQISQVIQNIVLNADQAMPLGGTVLIAERNVTAPGDGIPLQLAPGKYVEIAVSDMGIGIADRYLDRIFDPYFTTKEKGSGLGLATAYSIIRNHDGVLDVLSEIGKGTTFRIYLPAVEDVLAESTAATAPAAVRRGRVLVMDDEEVVRLITEKLLTAIGHEAESAGNGGEAVDKFSAALEAGRPFDVVILDLTVRGGMGGVETARKLREMDGSVRMIVSSGYSDSAVVADYREHGFGAFLKKPYTIDDLRAALSSCCPGA